MKCESCGFPMNDKDDHGGSIIANQYCKYCAPDGTLKSREEIREGWINYLITSENISQEEATLKVDEEMATMPAWKK